jgi:uncharacterized protein YneF (UPF0154 family)
MHVRTITIIATAIIIRVTLAGLVPGYYTQMLAEYLDHERIHPQHVRVHLFQSGLEPGQSRLQLGQVIRLGAGGWLVGLGQQQDACHVRDHEAGKCWDI